MGGVGRIRQSRGRRVRAGRSTRAGRRVRASRGGRHEGVRRVAALREVEGGGAGVSSEAEGILRILVEEAAAAELAGVAQRFVMTVSDERPQRGGERVSARGGSVELGAQPLAVLVGVGEGFAYVFLRRGAMPLLQEEELWRRRSGEDGSEKIPERELEVVLPSSREVEAKDRVLVGLGKVGHGEPLAPGVAVAPSRPVGLPRIVVLLLLVALGLVVLREGPQGALVVVVLAPRRGRSAAARVVGVSSRERREQLHGLLGLAPRHGRHAKVPEQAAAQSFGVGREFRVDVDEEL
mmetsp:Transcript_16613/g.51971  ORF Transcript_16613/g.51971 Transcript_16613/m.51971 type:complete len:294 (-) Transcript_16613:120-1001(-)